MSMLSTGVAVSASNTWILPAAPVAGGVSKNSRSGASVQVMLPLAGNTDVTCSSGMATTTGGTSLAFTPFVWTEETGMVDVHTLLDEDSRDWRLGALQMGRANESGQLLLHGALDNRYAVVVLTPTNNPEPGGLLMVAGAFAVLGLRRVRVRASSAS